jgi:uncharacterized protein YoaH (UPF0181 family)
MKHSDLFRTAFAAALSLALAAGPAVAKNNAAKAKPTVAKPASGGPKAKAQTPKAQAPKAAKAQAPKAKAQAPKTAGAAKTKSNTKTASAKGSATKADRSGEDTRTASRETFAAPTQPLSKAQQKLRDNPNLYQKMRLRLGSDPMVAASGFRNLGQFVAAVNVSNNLGMDFFRLKAMMVGRGMSLGQAIQQVKAMEARRATSLANTAVAQAEDEIAATSLVSVTATKKGKDKS